MNAAEENLCTLNARMEERAIAAEAEVKRLEGVQDELVADHRTKAGSSTAVQLIDVRCRSCAEPAYCPKGHMDGLMDVGNPPDLEIKPSEMLLWKNGRKIHALKAYRDRNGTSLKDTKEKFEKEDVRTLDLDDVMAECFNDHDVDVVLDAVANFLEGYGEGVSENYRDDAHFTASKRVDTAYGFAVPVIRAVAEGFKNE